MCRLLAWAGREPLTAARALGDQELDAFTSLSRQHADGWGVAWWPPDARDGDGAPLTERSTRCAADDARFTEVTTTTAADSGFAHLRWATHGLPVITANTHPFTHGRLAFAHNGAIHPKERWDEILPVGWTSRMRGNTDSERYFLAIVAQLEGGVPVREAVAFVVHRIFANLQPTSLNAMVLAPDALYVISAFDPARVPALGPSSGGASSSIEPDATFYDLHFRIRADSIVVGSSGFPQRADEGWEPLENMKLLRIERGTLATSIASLASSTVSLGS